MPLARPRSPAEAGRLTSSGRPDHFPSRIQGLRKAGLRFVLRRQNQPNRQSSRKVTTRDSTIPRGSTLPCPGEIDYLRIVDEGHRGNWRVLNVNVPNGRGHVTLRICASILLLASAVFSSGCAMCCGIDDHTYSTYGGKWERTDRTYGRVGSAFSNGQPGVMSTQEEVNPETLPAPGPVPGATPVGF